MSEECSTAWNMSTSVIGRRYCCAIACRTSVDLVLWRASPRRYWSIGGVGGVISPGLPFIDEPGGVLCERVGFGFAGICEEVSEKPEISQCNVDKVGQSIVRNA